MRFPNLRAFQVRNAVLAETELPRGFYLLDNWDDGGLPTSLGDIDEMDNRRLLDLGIDFMEAHPHLHCLAWPMDRFFQSNRNMTPRVAAIVDNLARTLTDLRVDHTFSGRDEPQTDTPSTMQQQRT